MAPTRAYVVFLVVVLGVFVAQAAFPEGPEVRLAQVVLQAGTLLLAFRLSGDRGPIRTVAVAVSAVAILAALAELVLDVDDSPAAGFVVLLNGLLVALAPAVVFRALRRQPRISLESVLAALSIYVLIGLFFAFVYRAVWLIDPDAFRFDGVLQPSLFQYFSFVTLTTVGFGDLTPASEVARTLTVLEALIGQLYLVTIVALVVSNLGRSRRDTGEG
jgi:hypothetical protein